MKKNKAKAKGLQKTLTQIWERLENIFSEAPPDLVAAIKMDHQGLRQFLDVLKDTDRDMSERRRAYTLFSALLKSHSESEEQVAYRFADGVDGREMHIKVAEGYVEHHVGEDLMKRIERTKKPLVWSAHANVLSETIEHHLREEERDLLPLIRKAMSPKTDQQLLKKYLRLRRATQKRLVVKNAGALKSL